MAMKRDFDRPTRHGAVLGEALAKIADEGPCTVVPPACLTCAFVKGTMANQSAATLKRALDALLHSDSGEFWCHRGIKEGEEPRHLCAGFVAARLAPFNLLKEHLKEAYIALALMRKDEPDHVREEFDAWLARIDPEGKMDDIYEMARLYARDRRAAREE